MSERSPSAAKERAESVTVTLAPGSLIVERYVWESPANKRRPKRTGVQWLVQVVTRDEIELVKTCQTKADALAAICEEAARGR